MVYEQKQRSPALETLLIGHVQKQKTCALTLQNT